MTTPLPVTRRSIRWQISLSFAVIMVIVLLVGGLGYFGVSRQAENFSSLVEIEAASAAILKLDRAVVDLNLNVQTFVFTGHEGVAERVEENLAAVERQLASVLALTSEEPDIELLRRMQGHLDTYKSTFEFAREERSLGRELLDQRIVQLKSGIDTALASRFASGSLSWEQQQEISRQFLATERNLYAYLSNPQYSLLEQGRSNIDAAQITLLSAGDTVAVTLLNEYAQVFTRIVQATRAYLYLTGVVMAAESAEFARVSAQLRDQATERLAPLKTEVEKLSQAIRVFALIGVLLALLLGVVFSSTMVRRLSRPLMDITSTFSRLAAGEQHASIPHADRDDEIGQLAAAAGVFQNRNYETQELLSKSRFLTTELEQKKSDLTESNAQLEEFVYTVSHDLKAPIVTSMNYIGVMRRLAGKGEAERALSKLGVLERAINSMDQLVDDLLDLSRVGRVETEKSLLNMNALLADLHEQCKLELAEQDAQLSIQENLPGVIANETRVRQVFDNLIRNALKYGSSNDGCRIEIGGSLKADGVEYYVRDHGPGIAPEFHQRVFELFQRLDKERRGTGVGLSIVEKVMRLHGGSVSLESQGNGDGACFRLWFPKGTSAA